MCGIHGGPLSDCTDKDKKWYPRRTICYADMESKAADALYEQLHEKAPFHDGSFEKWSGERSAAFPYHFRDGVVISVAAIDMDPDDDFLTPPQQSAAAQAKREAVDGGDQA